MEAPPQTLTPRLCITLHLCGIMDHSNSMLGASEVCPDLICPSNATCVNSTHCACLEGFQSRGGRFFTDTLETCDDIDECLGPNPVNCGPDAKCNNLPGSFYCTCADGYESSSGKARFPNASENSCQGELSLPQPAEPPSHMLIPSKGPPQGCCRLWQWPVSEAEMRRDPPWSLRARGQEQSLGPGSPLCPELGGGIDPGVRNSPTEQTPRAAAMRWEGEGPQELG
nr:CD97 antigen-like [Pelodiscus sinensis]|eukprot:XP_025044946.1 CD97 antigen-like [Pelodiscus sinensis]